MDEQRQEAYFDLIEWSAENGMLLMTGMGIV
jgi:hypothetical protein